MYLASNNTSMLKYAWNQRNVLKYQFWHNLQTIPRRDIRGLMLPWMVGMFFALLFQVFFFNSTYLNLKLLHYCFHCSWCSACGSFLATTSILRYLRKLLYLIDFAFEWYSISTFDIQKCCQKGVFAALVDFAWLAYNTYCWQVGFRHLVY